MTSIGSQPFPQYRLEHGVVRKLEAVARQVAIVNNVVVDLSGTGTKTVTRQDVALGKGVKALPPVPTAGLLDEATTSAALQMQAAHAFSADARRSVREAGVAGTPYEGLAFASSVEIVHTPVDAVRSVPGLGYIPGNVFLGGAGALDAYLRDQVDTAGNLARTERALQDEHGPEVKLALDAIGGDYVMLRPGQAGYDDVTSAQEVFAGMPNDLRKFGRHPDDFSDVFARYGLRV